MLTSPNGQPLEVNDDVKLLMEEWQRDNLLNVQPGAFMKSELLNQYMTVHPLLLMLSQQQLGKRYEIFCKIREFELLENLIEKAKAFDGVTAEIKRRLIEANGKTVTVNH